MNTEATNESNAAQTTGERLRNAREQHGLTQEAVAQRLCLKLSTVRDIEEDREPVGLASTFLRGYIRSYARLVQIPEEELLPAMESQVPVRAPKIEPMQRFALGKPRRKRDGLLAGITWLVLIIVVGLTCAWWWQNHKAQQDELVSMAEQSSADTSVSEGNTVPLHTDSASSLPTDVKEPAAQTTSSGIAPAPTVSNSQPSGGVSVPATTPVQSSAQESVAPQTSTPDNGKHVVASTQAGTTTGSATVSVIPPSEGESLPTTQAQVSTAAAEANSLLINFTADCWLEVSDDSGKKLFSGFQRKDSKLNLAGKAPYKLIIGAPAAVHIEFQGKPVDLSRFIRTNQVARLTIRAD